ncbi:MAG: SDR family oxidoreductase [Candidatus Eisenbacteria bacterium]|nr:SDR family oxidoreductase [Candidatus Eisenbacteria bacterium]
MSDRVSDAPDRAILLTGATGYIGGRLAPRLLDAGFRVRCVVRNRAKLAARPWVGREGLEIVEADIGDPENLRRAMEGCGAAYYLVHSMMVAGSDYARRDEELAKRFASAARDAGVGRILYLGGLGETGPDLSPHLRSRREVERAFASACVPVTVFRAAMIIGSGSASFEILRYLVERLPVMITPRWVSTESQPIAVSEALDAMVLALDAPETSGRTLDLGGPEVLSYLEIMRIMAEELGLRRRPVLPVPVLTPKLSSLWIHLVTPISGRIARPLAEGLRNRVVCRDDAAERLLPRWRVPIREAIREAVASTRSGRIETSWTDAGPMPGDPDWSGGDVRNDVREAVIGAPPETVFHAVCRIGGGNGWYAADLLWRIRGWMDRLAGGPGLRRGRRDPERIGYGDALDFWRVTAVEENRYLELRAEMKLPGEALLSFRIEPVPGDPGGSRLIQTARYLPRGLAGLLYWYSVLPFHGFVFRGMLGGIRRTAEEAARPGTFLQT